MSAIQTLAADVCPACGAPARASKNLYNTTYSCGSRDYDRLNGTFVQKCKGRPDLKTPANDAPAAAWGRFAVSIPGWRGPDLPPDCGVPALWDATSAQLVPDPDHWAWEGWMLRMLGGESFALWASAHFDSRDIGIGRGCISYAAALGRWPGGEQ